MLGVGVGARSLLEEDLVDVLLIGLAGVHGVCHHLLLRRVLIRQSGDACLILARYHLVGQGDLPVYELGIVHRGCRGHHAHLVPLTLLAVNLRGHCRYH